MAYEQQEWHPAFEEYCETIYELAEDGLEVKQARIAERLNVSRPAVSEMVRKMEREDIVTLSNDGEITLTDAGMKLALQVVRRHRLAERFLTDILELSWAEAHHEAGKWEHVISAPVEEALDRVLGSPTTCPHGNPIPGSDYTRPKDACVLASLEGGAQFVVQRIPEELEFEPGLLEYLEGSGVIPGREGKILSASPDGTVTVDVNGTPFGIGPFASERIVVTAA